MQLMGLQEQDGCTIPLPENFAEARNFYRESKEAILAARPCF